MAWFEKIKKALGFGEKEQAPSEPSAQPAVQAAKPVEEPKMHSGLPSSQVMLVDLTDEQALELGEPIMRRVLELLKKQEYIKVGQLVSLDDWSEDGLKEFMIEAFHDPRRNPSATFHLQHNLGETEDQDIEAWVYPDKSGFMLECWLEDDERAFSCVLYLNFAFDLNRKMHIALGINV